MAAARVAAADPLHGPPASAERAVFVDCIDGVLAARRRVPAMPAEKAAQSGAVDEDQEDEHTAHGEIVDSKSQFSDFKFQISDFESVI